jgi:octaprenyl-diphosphate synthase
LSATYLDAAREIAGSLAADLAEDVTRAEAVLHDALRSDSELVFAIGKHVGDAGGKRIRPLFVSLGARASGLDYSMGRIAALGACMEMIHMATLIHDDVIDGANTRRGRRTACDVYGNTAGILTGDVLLAKAMDILAEDGDLAIIRMVSKAVVEMATGEVMEVEARGNFDLDRERYLDILRAKTAVFLGACCKAGAIAAGGDDQLCRSMEGYGESVGMGFQVADDLLDFRGLSEATGKPRATDFREGCATMPLIHLRSRLSVEESEYVKSKFGNGVADSDLERISNWMSERDSYELTERDAAAYAMAAKAALDAIPSKPVGELLARVADLMICREA